MGLLLGIDTGGTYTDAVIVDPDAAGSGVIASAKSPTTHHDLVIGVASSIQQVLASRPNDQPIALVSVSTTLATNALVEGHGEPAGLLSCGFSQSELDRIGIAAIVDPDLTAILAGGHDAHGNEREPLDLDAAEARIRQIDPHVSGFAITSQFSVRNPGHELGLGQLVRDITNKPVTYSHVLSAKLDGPRRALTAVLNARLIGTIDRLITAVRAALVAASIDAPLMIVRGDGSLVSAAFAVERPIETILSGPAASVIGALHLAGISSGLVSDIGGTTTDIAVVTKGRPGIAASGAVVGGWRTMVEAVDMATVGLGGDSEVRVDTRHVDGPVVVGPERAVPICRLALDFAAIHDDLDRQLAEPVGTTYHGRFLLRVGDAASADAREQAILDELANGPRSIALVGRSGLAATALGRLRARGLVRLATLTPTDAAAVLGLHSDVAGQQVDVNAATKVAQLIARQSGSNGAAIAADARELCEIVVAKLTRQSAEFAIGVALSADGIASDAQSPAMIAAALDNRASAARLNVGLGEPLTAIGAPAGTYYQRVAELVGTTAIVPPHAEVANAVGAVVGQVRVRRTATISQPSRGQFRVHIDDQPTFGSVANARSAARAELTAAATADAERAGAATPEITESWHERTAVVNGKEIFVEGQLTVEVSGRPRL